MCSFQLKIKQSSEKKLWLPRRFVFLRHLQQDLVENEVQRLFRARQKDVEDFYLQENNVPEIETIRLKIRNEIDRVLGQYQDISLADALSVVRYNPIRLGEFVAKMRKERPQDYLLLTEKILEENVLNEHKISTDRRMQEFLARLMFIYESKGHNYDAIKEALDGIVSKLESTTEAAQGTENINKNGYMPKQRIKLEFASILLDEIYFEEKHNVNAVDLKTKVAVRSVFSDIYRPEDTENTEVTESITKTSKGSLQKTAEWIASKFSRNKNFTAREVIENLIYIDKTFSVFAGLDLEISAVDLYDHIKKTDGMNSAKLPEACAYLAKSIKELTANKKKAKPSDIRLLKAFIHKLQLVYPRMISIEFCDKIAKSPEGVKYEDHMKNLLNEQINSDAVLEENLRKIEADASLGELFNNIALESKYFASLVEAEKYCIEHKLKGKNRMEYLRSKAPYMAIKLLEKKVKKKLKIDAKKAKEKKVKPKTKFTESRWWRYSPLRPLAWGVGKIWGWAYGPSTSAPSHKPSTAKESKGGH